jgi:AraC-like DNA-binding protein
LQDKLLQRAKEILKEGQLKASDIYQDMGYNLSNFSIAFKNKLKKSKRNSLKQKKNVIIFKKQISLIIYVL